MGRPRGRKTVSHAARGKVCATIRAALTAGGHKPTFRVVEFNALHSRRSLAADLI